MKRIFGNKTVLLGFIIVLASFLRFYNLGVNPPSLTWDEVAWGYNAYSLGIDGKDEHGRFLPLNYLESFGDFKPPLYAYLDVIPVKIFGLNEFAVRFPSAILGSLTVLITYLLVNRIFKKHEEPLALLSAFFLAISPWHINLSRAAFEANVSSFFIVCGVWLFLKSVQEKMWFLPLSVASFVISIYIFNTARIVAPILLLILFLIHVKQILRYKTQLFVSVIFGIILILPIVRFLFSPQAGLRFKEVNIFSDIGVINLTNQEIKNDNNAWWSKILHNRRFVYATEYLKHYFDHFKPKFLFISGDGNPKFSTQDVGSLYLWELPFFITGVLFIFRWKAPYRWFILLWMIIGVAPAATARETPHALRIEAVLPTFQIFTAYGVFMFINTISNIKYKIANIQIKYLKFTLCFLFLIFNILYYLHGYYVHYPREYSGEWQYGYKESIAFVKEQEQNFDEIKITTELGRPYIYYLFYTKTDPEKFRKTAKIEREVFGFVNVEKVGKYSFAKDVNSITGKNKKILYVDIKNKLPDNAIILKTFYLLNGEPVLVAYTL